MKTQTQNGSYVTSPRAVAAVRTSLRIYGTLATATLVAVAAVAAAGHQVNTFMWVRAALLPLIAVALHRLAASAATGSRRAYDRLGAVTLVMPIAIVAVDLIPGICPLWYAAAQTACMLPVLYAARLVRTSAWRGAFPVSR
ncbi:hypothetical protein ACIQF6_09370 [Kitasatospora sp. NPDC092948]|uniref:hypothetical protein n=1 Tax=Kitasatospora sp. NPDC092948 TaxID=3364088 RepID=UPI0037FD01D0